MTTTMPAKRSGAVLGILLAAVVLIILGAAFVAYQDGRSDKWITCAAVAQLDVEHDSAEIPGHLEVTDPAFSATLDRLGEAMATNEFEDARVEQSTVARRYCS